MKITIETFLEEKLLLDSEKMQMSPTRYINFLIEQIDIEVPAQAKITIVKEVPKLNPTKVQRGINNQPSFIKDY